MAKLYNLARMTTATTGTGTMTLGAAVSGFLTFAATGVADGDPVSYGIKDGANSEVGVGVYTSSGTTLTRTVTKSTNSNAPISLSGTAEVFITARAEDFLELLNANRTYFVRTDGSDSNNGLANTAGGAFLTLQKAANVVFGLLDLNGFDVTIQIGDGTYAAGVLQISPQTGAGTITFNGNAVNPQNVVIQGGGFTSNGYGTKFVVSNMEIPAGSNQSSCSTNLGGQIQISGTVRFNLSGTGRAILSSSAGQVSMLNNPTMVLLGAAGQSFATGQIQAGVNLFGSTLSIPAATNITFSGPFIDAQRLGYVGGNGCTITVSGTVTGQRYNAQSNAVINTSGGGANFFPGSVAGSTATGGQYL